MTAPGVQPPPGAYRVRGSGSPERWGQDETGQAAKDKMKAPILGAFGGAKTNFLELAFGGFVNGIAGLINALLGGIFGFFTGGLVDLVGGFLGIRNDVNQVREVEVPRLDNRIDTIEAGGGVTAQRAAFFQPGTWTKPEGYSRHVIDVIGGGSGGARRASLSGDTRISGGFAGGWTTLELFDSDLPATVAVTIGLGGAGSTSDGAFGSPGGDSAFGNYVAAGGALASATGFGNKTLQLRGGGGGNTNAIATAGTGHSYANGGAPGVSGGDLNGRNGNRPTPNTLPYPGTGGGGGERAGSGDGGRGGHGAVPGGPGGGGAIFNFFGFSGNGGNGAPGAVFITSYK